MAQFHSFGNYKWATGSVHKTDPNIAAKVTAELEEQGKLNAKNLVDVSRPEDAPLHNEFEWDNDVAAEKYREEQARGIIRHLQVVVEENKPQKVYCNLIRTEAEYTTIEKAIRQEDTREMLLRNAFREMETFRLKYESLKELAEIFTVTDKLKEELAEKLTA